MTNLQLPQITLDKLLQLKVGEGCGIINPTDLDIEKNEDLYKVSTTLLDGKFTIATEQVLIEKESPIQPNEEFYISEEFGYYENPFGEERFLGYNIHKSNLYVGDMSEVLQASQMTPEQSRFHGVCVDVEVKKANEIPFSLYADKNSHKYVEYAWKEFVAQHNELHSCNIKPSLNAYVLYVTIRRTK